MPKLIELISDLAKSPDKLAEFKKNPNPVMKDYGLEKDEKDALLSGDKEKLVKVVNEKLDKILPAHDMFPNG